ncbi:MAG TPA: TonB family protein [Rhizomicrobium sp.]|jgi:TonB family protein
MRAFIVAIAAFVPLIFVTAAFAENTTPAPATPPALDTSNPHNNCASGYYPPRAVRLNEQGATTVLVHIDATGKPTDTEVATSSGFEDLDQASRDCIVKNWHFTPATQDGKSVASTKQYRIVWKLTGNTSQPHLVAPMEVACADIFADAKPRWTSYQSAAVQFRITVAGTTMFPFIAISSGDTLFDAKAVQCITRLKYNAAILDDVAKEVSWSAAVRWSPRTGLAYTDPYRIGPYCPDGNFPADLWKGDPPDSTVISFHIVQGGVTAGTAIERSSGNPALDQAALKCVQTWRSPFAAFMATAPDVGANVRFNWREGHAFVLDDGWR